MMKYNVRTINGKRIVGGDPNLATKNEIHVSKIPEELGINSGTPDGGGASGGSIELKDSYITWLFDYTAYKKEDSPIFLPGAEFINYTQDHLGNKYSASILKYIGADKALVENDDEVYTFTDLKPCYIKNEGDIEVIEKVEISKHLNTGDYGTYYRYYIYTKNHGYAIEEVVGSPLDFNEFPIQ